MAAAVGCRGRGDRGAPDQRHRTPHHPLLGAQLGEGRHVEGSENEKPASRAVRALARGFADHASENQDSKQGNCLRKT